MAEGGDYSSLSTKGQQLQRERHQVRLNLGGMASRYTVVQGPAPVCDGLEDVGKEPKQGMWNNNWHVLNIKKLCYIIIFFLLHCLHLRHGSMNLQEITEMFY